MPRAYTGRSARRHAARPSSVDWASRISRLRRLERYHLLVVDEIGYLPLERQAANLLFALVARRYERGSIIVTSNRGFEAWGRSSGSRLARGCTGHGGRLGRLEMSRAVRCGEAPKATTATPS
jgi:hypothetical protein